jgi:hypothetical protein
VAEALGVEGQAEAGKLLDELKNIVKKGEGDTLRKVIYTYARTGVLITQHIRLLKTLRYYEAKAK